MKAVYPMAVVVWRIGAEHFVFRFDPQYLREALRLPGLLAAQGGPFNYFDAQCVTALMRAEAFRLRFTIWWKEQLCGS